MTHPHIAYRITLYCNVSTVGPQTVYSHPPVATCKQRAALTIALFSASNDLGVWALNLSGALRYFDRLFVCSFVCLFVYSFIWFSLSPFFPYLPLPLPPFFPFLSRHFSSFRTHSLPLSPYFLPSLILPFYLSFPVGGVAQLLLLVATGDIRYPHVQTHTHARVHSRPHIFSYLSIDSFIHSSHSSSCAPPPLSSSSSSFSSSSLLPL